MMMVRFEDGIEAQIPALRRYARALTRDRDRAEDLLQDCLERALSKRTLFRRPGNLRSWLFRIMHNLYVNYLRSGDDPAGQTPPEQAVVVPNQIPTVEVKETLQAFTRLPVHQRQALLLVAVEGMTYCEAAEVLHIPVGTVLSRVSRARQSLHAGASATDRPGALLSIRRREPTSSTEPVTALLTPSLARSRLSFSYGQRR
jgi:RNA polymerase sigma-70 factor, ECF subfamily